MRSRGRSSELTTDLTPLIDVVFLLLIFFMVSSVFKKDQYALGLSLPKSETGKQENKIKEKEVIIELTANEIAFNGRKVDLGELSSLLRPLDKKSIVQLRVSKSVVYERLVKVLDLLQRNKLMNISLITEKKSQNL